MLDRWQYITLGHILGNPPDVDYPFLPTDNHLRVSTLFATNVKVESPPVQNMDYVFNSVVSFFFFKHDESITLGYIGLLLLNNFDLFYSAKSFEIGFEFTLKVKLGILKTYFWLYSVRCLRRIR
jgi:hypothetical protein